MVTLNLVNPSTSYVKFEVSRFPDGQQNITLQYIPEKDNNGLYGKRYIEFINRRIQIKARLNNFQDLELIICTTKALREEGIKHISLYTPYFLGSRSDRKFEVGSCNYLKDVICPIINSLNFESITVLDPHSDVLEACLNNFRKESNEELVRWSLSQMKGVENITIVSPDAGASKKIFKLMDELDYEGDIITCSKDRDTNGELTHTKVFDSLGLSETYNFGKKNFIIIDDICDGGATFINIAKEVLRMKESYKIGKLYLIVTHGIFSKGFLELSKYFDGVYCTNSYNDITENWTFGQNKLTKDLVKQLNVF